MKLVEWFQRHQRLRGFIQLFVIVACLGFVFWNLADNWRIVRSYNWQFDGIRCGLATFCLTVAFGLLPLASQQALAGLGYHIGYQEAYRGYFITQLAKYLPGGLWIIPGRVLVFGQIGINIISSSVGMIIELCLLLFSGIVVFLPYFLANGAESLFQVLTIGASLAMASLLGLHPRVFNPVLRWLMARVGYANVVINITFRRIITIVLIDVAFWLAAGSSLFLLVSAIQSIPLSLWAILVSAFSMAWVAGFLAFLTPGGIGVRESALAFFLAPFLPTPLPVVIALLARVWWTAAELISVAIAAILGRNLKASILPSRHSERRVPSESLPQKPIS